MVRKELVLSEDGYILFDDTVLDKNHSFAIELVRRQWSGNAKKVIKGIGLVTCVYVNPDIDKFWVIDYRILTLREMDVANSTTCWICGEPFCMWNSFLSALC